MQKDITNGNFQYIKIKVLNESKEEFRKFYYDCNKKEKQNCLLAFDQPIGAAIKNYSFIINIKKKLFGFKTYLLDEEIDLKHLNLVNEMFHTFRFKEYSLDVKIRIR